MMHPRWRWSVAGRVAVACAASLLLATASAATPPASAPGGGVRAELAARGFRCSDEVAGWSCPDLQAQIDAGSVMRGVYRQCGRVAGAVSFNGAWLKDTICAGKAALIATDGAILRDVRITGPSNGLNGACVRWQGGRVEVRALTCVGADMGILGRGERLVVADSEIRHSNQDRRDHGHLVYAAAGRELLIHGSTLADPGAGGHAVKSGMATTRIEASTLAGAARPYSRLIDAFNGGRLLIADSKLRAGAHGGSGALIGYGAEMRQRFADNAISLTGGVVDCTAALTVWAVRTWLDRVRPETVVWRPGESRGCPKPT